MADLLPATKIRFSEMTPGTANERNPWGTLGLWQPKIVSSPVVDTVSTSTWYLGDPVKQFWLKRAFGIETAFQGADSDAGFERDIVMRFRVAFDVEVGAVDYVYFVQNTA